MASAPRSLHSAAIGLLGEFRVHHDEAQVGKTQPRSVGSPANPTGAVQPRETMAALARLGVLLVSDEVYDGLVYDGAHATSALEVADGADVYVLDGFSRGGLPKGA
jgi:aminotransferase